MPFKDVHQELSDTQILEFANKWYDDHVGHPIDREWKKRRFQEYWKREDIKELICNYTLLDTIVKLNNYCEPPATRNQLYKECIQFLLNDWEATRAWNVGNKDFVVANTDKMEVLIWVAAFIYVSKAHDLIARHLIPEYQLEQIIAIQLGRIGIGKDCEKLSQQIVKQIKLRERVLYDAGEGHWGFAHQRFFEYCLAQYFLSLFHKREWDTDDLCHLFAKHFPDERWHGMLSLLAEAVDISFVPKILETLLSLDSVETQDFSNVFLAARCVAEIKWWNEIAESVNVLQEVLQALARNPRFQVKALAALKAIEIRKL